jgi:hypothetical protein
MTADELKKKLKNYQDAKRLERQHKKELEEAEDALRHLSTPDYDGLLSATKYDSSSVQGGERLSQPENAVFGKAIARYERKLAMYRFAVAYVCDLEGEIERMVELLPEHDRVLFKERWENGLSVKRVAQRYHYDRDYLYHKYHFMFERIVKNL